MKDFEDNIFEWHPEAVGIHDRLEEQLNSITGGNEEYLRIVNETRNAIAGAIWEEEERANKASNDAWLKNNRDLANIVAAKASGLVRARDIVSSVNL